MLELVNINAGYDGHVVLRDVSIKVPDRSVVALLGPNGAGKTTLLRVASGLLQPTSGRLLVDGDDLTGSAPCVLAQSGMCHVPEGRGVFPTLSVRDNLRLQAPNDLDEETLDIVTTHFPILGERMDQVAGSLSGGEQQMLALAHGYVAETSLMLVDEASMGLAPVVVDQIFDHLRELAANGCALLLVEQYVSRALDMADYVYILQKGRIQFAGEPRELREGTLMASYLGEA
jgi:branched-chain amino acid transport system ATP-binding protein